MNEQLENLKWLVENVPNINESMSFLITELEETQKAFDELDSDYINLIKENKRYRDALGFYGNKENYLHELSRLKATNYSKVMDDYGEIARKALEESE